MNCGSEPARGNTWNDAIDRGGEFVREPTEFRDWVKAKGGRFPVDAGRYHLYVSYACPWAHRTLIVRALKGLEAAIGVSVVHPFLDARGWHFSAGGGAGGLQDGLGAVSYGTPEPIDDLYHSSLLSELYDKSVDGARYRGRVTVPVLWDRERETIVNNESSEIIRMLNGEFNAYAEHPDLDLYPPELRGAIDELNAWIYPAINNGVYRCGFATKQAPYESAFVELFDALDRAEEILSRHRYLTGPRLTEADIRLFTTLVRFDPVYHNHFRCNRRKLREYHHLWNYLLELAQLPKVADTIRLDHIKAHYYQSHTTLNPSQIVPLGPEYDLSAPHDRAGLTA